MANQKPLPALPGGPDLTTLSVEARNHRARLIGHFLNDLHEPGIQSRREGWLYALEEALDGLGHHISRGEWLNAIKREKSTKLRLQEVAQKQSDDDSQPPERELGAESKPLPERPEPPLKVLRNLASRPALPVGEPRVGHLVLCLTPYGSHSALPTEDSGFDIVPANIGCDFASAIFSLQESSQDEVSSVLYGVEGLQGERNSLYVCKDSEHCAEKAQDSHLRLVGGTFTLRGVNSPIQHHLLFKALKLAIYIHLSLILEQHLLSDLGITLKFPRPKFPPPSPSSPARTPPESPNDTKEVRTKPRNSIIPSSFTNFFLKRNLSYRGSQTISPAGRGGSLDLTVAPPLDQPGDSPRKSPDVSEGAFSGLRLRRFSFITDKRHSFLRPHQASPTKHGPEMPSQPFINALKRIEESKDLLSTSAGVTLALPRVIVAMAEKEKMKLSQAHFEGQKQLWKLKGDEKVALTSLLGWNGKESEGRGMSGILGFIHQQQISVLLSHHTPPSAPTISSTSSVPPSVTATASAPTADPQGSSAFSTSTTTTTLSTTSSNLPSVGLSSCGKPHWKTYRYFSTSPDEDGYLGDRIMELAKRRNDQCYREGCSFRRGEHETRIIHDGVRIVVRIMEEQKEPDDDKEANPNDAEEIQLWESCAVCSAKTSRRTLGKGTSYVIFMSKFISFLAKDIFYQALLVCQIP